MTMKLARIHQSLGVVLSNTHSYSWHVSLMLHDKNTPLRPGVNVNRMVSWDFNGNYKHNKVWQDKVVVARGTHSAQIRNFMVKVIQPKLGIPFQDQLKEWATRCAKDFDFVQSVNFWDSTVYIDWAHHSWKRSQKIRIGIDEQGKIRNLYSYGFKNEVLLGLSETQSNFPEMIKRLKLNTPSATVKNFSPQVLSDLEAEFYRLYPRTKIVTTGIEVLKRSIEKEFETHLAQL